MGLFARFRDWWRGFNAPDPDPAMPASTGWLCWCGHWQEDDFHCGHCGDQPPRGCPGAGDCCLLAEDEDDEYESFDNDDWDDFLDPDLADGDKASDDDLLDECEP